ncbi:MAG: hypothetical protein WA012_02860, partial [Rhodoferax sp.]|uniref:hypothetical protein n=2 Tax=Rhodoferax sp. TaxID=50421 RepID=UPI003BB69BF5
TSLVIGKYPLKFGERRRETARIHFQNLASNSHFGNQPDRQGSNFAAFGLGNFACHGFNFSHVLRMGLPVMLTVGADAGEARGRPPRRDPASSGE